MLVQAVSHQMLPTDIYPLSRQKLFFRLRTGRLDVKSCKLVCWLRSEPANAWEIDMTVIRRDNLFDYFAAVLAMEPAARYIKYYFKLTDSQGKCGFFSNWGYSENQPDEGFFEYLYTNEHEIANPPAWASGQIYYQIFPERFCNGDRANDRPDAEAWGSQPSRENFMGGDLAGIIQKADYLASLGVDCLYLTPIFKAAFNHKYATIDYYEIDPDFGDKTLLRKLVETCHAKGIRILLDGVFNHCGVDFPPFRDVLDNQENSEYRDWFYIKKFPVEIALDCYECVGDYQWMPKLRSAQPAVRRYILDVMKYWICEFGIDGWRLDVADEVDCTAWQQARLELKDLNAEILLLGETWGDGTRMLLGDQMDSVMNYLFRDLALAFFAHRKIDTVVFDNRIENLLARYTWETDLMLYNPLDSHDTSRFLQECGGDIERFKLAAAFQLLFCGSPAIFYGDEVGLSGENDPDCRRCMVWEPEKQNLEILSWYRQLIDIRKSNLALTRGSYHANICDPQKQIYGFIRQAGDQTIYIVFNNGQNPQDIEIPVLEGEGDFEELLGGERHSRETLRSAEIRYNQDLLGYQGQVMASLPAYSVKVFRPVHLMYN